MLRCNKMLVILLVSSMNCQAQLMSSNFMSIDTIALSGSEWLSKENWIRSFYQPEDSIRLIDAKILAHRTFDWLLYYDFYTTLTAFHSLNNDDQPNNNLFFYYNVDIKNKITYRNFTWDLYLFNDYGVKHFFDSITIKTQDQLTIKNSVGYPLYKRKYSFTISANTQTKLWKTHQLRTNDRGIQERFLYDGFMSPGTIYYAGGISYYASGNAVVMFGLGSSKVTKIRKQSIFEERNETEISGLKKGEYKRSEFGLTCTATVPLQKLSRIIHWEYFCNVYAPINSLKEIKKYTVAVNNVFHVVLLKYVRISWRTKIDYNPLQNEKAIIENQISLGFYLSNHL